MGLPPSDAELVRCIADGAGAARSAEAELCRRFVERVRLYGLRHLRSEERSADLTQSVLLAVLEAARAGRLQDPERIDRFVLGTCRHVAARLREHDARAEPTEPELLDLLARAPEPEHVDTGALVNCLAALDARARTVVQMTYQSEKSSEEIAIALSTTSGNVRVLRHRAMAQLRRCLDRGKEARA